LTANIIIIGSSRLNVTNLNQLGIPTILAVAVLVAGMFVFMPVQKATTVHTGIQNTVIREATFTDANWEATGEDANDDGKRITCTASAVIHELSFDVENLAGATDNIDLIIDPDGATVAFDAVTQVDIFGGNPPSDEVTLFATRNLDQGVALTTNGFIELRLTGEAADGNNETVDIIVSYTSQGTCSIANA
jgi:hypothetical protein